MNRKKRRAAEHRPVQTMNAPTWQIEETQPSVARMTIGARAVPVTEIKAVECGTEPKLKRELRRLRHELGVTRLDVVIDCRGGSVAVANGILRALDKWKGRKRCLIDGSCCSAATIIAFGPEWQVAITPGSHVMIHKPRLEHWTRRGTGLWEMLVKLPMSSTVELMRNVYAHKTGRLESEVAEWIEQGRSFSAAQACVFGLCDEMLSRTDWEKRE
ncbi:MAG: ATP-dependent Clp protease proteolytic subunit [Oscillospiraceae bacterium]|nr:ATP-dependent Clp protease proteolytic subunit [Oscillospiraceae bacterium]